MDRDDEITHLRDHAKLQRMRQHGEFLVDGVKMVTQNARLKAEDLDKLELMYSGDAVTYAMVEAAMAAIEEGPARLSPRIAALMQKMDISAGCEEPVYVVPVWAQQMASARDDL